MINERIPVLCTGFIAACLLSLLNAMRAGFSSQTPTVISVSEAGPFELFRCQSRVLSLKCAYNLDIDFPSEYVTDEWQLVSIHKQIERALNRLIIYALP